MRPLKICPSILAADFSRLGEEVRGVLRGDDPQPPPARGVGLREELAVHGGAGVLVQGFQRQVVQVRVGVHVAVAGGDLADVRIAVQAKAHRIRARGGGRPVSHKVGSVAIPPGLDVAAQPWTAVISCC